MSLKILPPKLENLNKFPEDIKALLIKLFENKESNNKEIILSNFFLSYSENNNIKTISEKLKFDRNKKSFLIPLDFNNIYSLFTKEFIINKENKEENNNLNIEQSEKKDLNIPSLKNKEEKSEILRRSTRIRYKKHDEDQIFIEEKPKNKKKTLLKKKKKRRNNK